VSAAWAMLAESAREVTKLLFFYQLGQILQYNLPSNEEPPFINYSPLASHVSPPTALHNRPTVRRSVIPQERLRREEWDRQQGGLVMRAPSPPLLMPADLSQLFRARRLQQDQVQD